MLPRTDKGLRQALLAIDRHEDCLLTRAEAAWMLGAVYEFSGEWSVEQRARAAQIVNRYRDFL